MAAFLPSFVDVFLSQAARLVSDAYEGVTMGFMFYAFFAYCGGVVVWTIVLTLLLKQIRKDDDSDT